MQKKVLNNPDNHNGMVTHLEADNLESKVKRTLGSIITKKNLVEAMEFHLSYLKS